MKAFLKRRWLLLSGAAVFLGCSFIDFEVSRDGGAGGTYESRGGGLWRGRVNYFYASWAATPEHHFRVLRFLHPPILGGGGPKVLSRAGDVEVSVPLWFLLSAIIGWIVFRELRWREKHAKHSSSALPDTTISALYP